MKPYARLACVAALLAATLTLGSVGAAEDAIEHLPPLALRETAGGPALLSEWADTPLVLNVWATWCGPCRKEMPALQALSERLAPKGIRVVALSVDDDVNLMREFLIKYGVTLPTPVAASASEAFRLLKAFALPVTFYVGRGGKILGLHTGARSWDDEAVVQELLGILGATHTARGAP